MNPRTSTKVFWLFAAIGSLTLVLAGHTAVAKGNGNQGRLVQQGRVATGNQGIPHATVTIYQAGKKQSNIRKLGSAKTDETGEFTLLFKKPNKSDAILYVIADNNGSPHGRKHKSDSVDDGRHGRKHKSDSVGHGRHGRKHKSDSVGPVRLATVIGQQQPDYLTINERTTVATAYSMAQFIDGDQISGPKPGMPNAAAIAHNIVSVPNGRISRVLDESPNGDETSARPTVNTLANLLSACVRDRSQCDDLFQLTKTPGAAEPNNTLDAIISIARNPGNNVEDLNLLALTSPVYVPALGSDAATDPDAENAINSFVLGIRYISVGPNGPVLNGPGNIAIDSKGNAWVNNNYAYGEDNTDIVCGSTALIELTPTGETPPLAPFGGDDTLLDGVGAAGLYGAGFGIGIDPDENVWVSNFGFQGQVLPPDPRDPCSLDAESLAVSVSKFNSLGEPRSPDGDPQIGDAGGFQVLPPDEKKMQQPQGVLSDRDGNVWVAGCVDGTVTRFRNGNGFNPDFMKVSEQTIDGSDQPIAFDKAFDVAIDNEGDAWVSANGTSTVVQINQDFEVITYLDEGFRFPMGIASDSAGDLWVSNAALPNPPCPPELGWDPLNDIGDENRDGVENVLAAVSHIDTSVNPPQVTSYGREDGGRSGLRWPWGIAVDGRDNVWIANFAGQRIMHLCGGTNAICPDDKGIAEPLSPDDGYYFNGLERVTAVQVDPSGNIWMTNNWTKQAFLFPENPGGNHVVVFIGLAGPVRTPLLGSPRQP